MKKIIYIFLAILMLFSCKKSREARKLEKYIANTTWEFYKAEDADGNDITAQVLADSVICTKFTFNKYDNDPSTFDADICGCHNTYYESYKAPWGITDWKRIIKKDKRKGYNGNYSNQWKVLGLSIGNVGKESYKPQRYLRQIGFKVNKENDILESRIYVLEFSGFPTDTLLEKRYYKKIN